VVFFCADCVLLCTLSRSSCTISRLVSTSFFSLFCLYCSQFCQWLQLYVVSQKNRTREILAQITTPLMHLVTPCLKTKKIILIFDNNCVSPNRFSKIFVWDKAYSVFSCRSSIMLLHYLVKCQTFSTVWNSPNSTLLVTSRHVRRVERVEPCCSTSSTQPECMVLTRGTCPK